MSQKTMRTFGISLFVMFAATGCSVARFEEQVRRDYALTPTDLRSIQFWTKGEAILLRGEDGRTIEIPEGTPAVAFESGPGYMVVDVGSGLNLTFRPLPAFRASNDRTYMLASINGTHVNVGSIALYLDGERFLVEKGRAVFLTYDFKGSLTGRKKTTVVSGRILQYPRDR